uniref:nodal-related 2 n=1 Tax=Pristiophorus japonicus TaxID=55135 RepID=UPI00398F728E
MQFPSAQLLIALVFISLAQGNPTGNWTRRVLESKAGPPPTLREVATFIQRLEARNISLNLPSHMINLYRSYNSGNYAGLSSHERPVLSEANTVRSLIAKSFRHNGSRWIVTFDMSTLARNEKLQFAELRISLPAFAESCSLLEMHHQSQYPCGGTTCRQQLLLGSFPPATALEEAADCAVYNVTDILRRWMERSAAGERPEEPAGLGQPDRPVCPGRERRSLPVPPEEPALLLVFSRRPERGCPAGPALLRDAKGSRRVRQPRRRKGPRRRPKQDGKAAGRPQNGRGKGRGRGRAERSGAPGVRHHNNSRKSTRCRRIAFQIKFGKIGWGTWVIFPKVYNAYRCEGECPSPSGELDKPTNHAYMQSLLKFHHPTLVPSPCCVPIKMNPVSMLYIEKGEVVLRHHENMVVQECGCR